MPLDLDYLMTFRVPRRVQHLDLSVVAQMERASLDGELPGISRALTAAIERAERFVPASLRRDHAIVLQRSFRRAGIDPDAWLGAVTVCYAAVMAGCSWKHIDVDTLHELIDRWDLTTRDYYGDSIERTQLRAMGVELGLAVR